MTKNEEGQPTMPHSYDGIEEYDNPLPFWWVALFWVTIVFSIGYWAYYHFGDGPSIQQTYDADMKNYYDQQAQVLAAAGAITDDTLRGMQSNSAMMATAKATFAIRCVVCHGEHAEGKIGPNLTDRYWLHGGRLTDHFRTISEGVPEKGMISWKTQLAPAEMMSLAAYVGTLQGTNPANPKEPQGVLYDPASSTPQPAPSSTAPASTNAQGPASKTSAGKH
ncbi:MAG: cbb3-type cytochrome c oxidase N-terminal domain-containing protein [Acidobacteriota bacterium]